MNTAPQRPVPGTRYEPVVKCKYTAGQRVVGRRFPVKYEGEFVRSYVTVNNGFRNVAYVVKCDFDGKERSFQGVTAL